MEELANWLAHECRLLEIVLFKLVEERHLLAAGDSRFLGLAAAEVQRAVSRLREAQLRRSMLVSARARELGLPEEGVTLDVLGRQSREPYRTIFDDHRRALLDLLAEVDEVTGQNQRLAAIGTKRTGPEEHYELRLADTGYQVVLGAQLSMPALRDFLS